MQNFENMMLKAIRNFPSWSNIRKRPEKSNGYIFLKALLEEQKKIAETLSDFIKSFFLVYYVGKEETIFEKGYIFQVGNISIDKFSIESLAINVTTDASTFLNDLTNYCLYQDGFLLFSVETCKDEQDIVYTYNNYKYKGTVVLKPIWNIIDEFALFLGLERFEDENNANLLKRCFAVFSNSANSTEAGIKNAIVNSLIGIEGISADEIKIENPSPENMKLKDFDGEEIYEKLALLNKDTFRTKLWDMDTWEHKFKQIMYLSHKWDKPLDVYQDGTGHGANLEPFVNDGTNDTTDVTVSAYKTSQQQILEYVQKNNIDTNITLGLTKYGNTLKSQEAQYKIVASKAVKINPDTITVSAKRKINGEITYPLEELDMDHGKLTVTNKGQLPAGDRYKLKFLPVSEYSDMTINKIKYMEDGVSIKDLAIEKGYFKFNNGKLTNRNIALHATSLNQLKTYKNIQKYYAGGYTISSGEIYAEMAISVTGMGGKYVKPIVSDLKENITSNIGLIDMKHGFSFSDDKKLIADSLDSDSNTTIEVKCSYVYFSLEKAVDNKQGSCIVSIYVNGKIDAENSGLWTTGGRKYEASFNGFVNVKIEIQKIGMYPVVIDKVLVKRYYVKESLIVENNINKYDLISTAFGNIIPAIPNQMYYKLSIENIGTISPVIEAIHVGASSANITYETDVFESGAGGCLDIDSENCIVQLIQISKTNNQIVVNSNYSTKKEYYNGTANSIPMQIDISDFEEITDSSKRIEYTAKDGYPISYINITPGERISTITIGGIINRNYGRKTLRDLLSVSVDEEVYVSKNANGFIISNTSTDAEKIVTISRKQLHIDADLFSFDNLPTTVQGVFITDKIENISVNGNNINNNFEEAFLLPTDNSEHIAYNKITMFQSKVSNVQITNVFSPQLDMNTLMLYRIENTDTTVSALFEKSYSGNTVYEDWSLGVKRSGITVEIPIDLKNNEQYDIEISSLTQKFTLSNTIDLEKEYLLNGESVNLSRYILTAPEDISIIYSSDSVVETVIAEIDGFNKLYYSNIEQILSIKVDGNPLPLTSYSVILENGIIIWNDNTLAGQEIIVTYIYKVPRYLKYKSINSLYKLAKYNVEAYELIENCPIILKDMKDNDSKSINFAEVPAKVIVKCTNKNFSANYNNGIVTVKNINNENKIMVNTGYYYDNGQEYYMFDKIHTEIIDKSSGIKLHNVDKYGSRLNMHQYSDNFVLNSVFKGNEKDIICHIDCKQNENIVGASKTNSITACETFNLWKTYRMNTSIVSGINDTALKFVSQKEESYAIMEITDYIKPNVSISLYASDRISAYIMKDIPYDNDVSFTNSMYCEKYIELVRDDKFLQVHMSEDIAESKYYLMITGSGTIDDLIISDEDISIIKQYHKKNIIKTGLVFDEKHLINTKIKHNFVSTGAEYCHSEITSNGTLITGSSVNWGLTKVYDITEDLNRCTTSNVTIQDTSFVAEEKNGRVTTPIIVLDNYKSIRRLIVKINDVMLTPFMNFGIKILGAKTRTEEFTELISDSNTNIVTLNKNKVLPYIQIVADIEKSRVIENLEVYAEYAELEGNLHVNEYTSGYLLTKIFNLGTESNYAVSSIVGKITDDVNIYVRGLRQDFEHNVWTSWYELIRDENNDIVNSHIFKDYKMFQFKIMLSNKDASCQIEHFVFEVY